jgi:NADH-quinone oxidoreductase subunit N
MNLENFMLMRDEVLLTAIILIMLVAEVLLSGKNKKYLIQLGLVLFGAYTLQTFFGNDTGSLFGGSYKPYPLVHFFKAILAFGVFIILLQSVSWLKEKLLPYDFTAEFFILIFSSLLGLNFMVSAGDFLMFYLGLELSTMPIIALTAFEFWNHRSIEAGVKYIMLASVSSAILLFGVSLVYATAGSINFDVIKGAMQLPLLEIIGLIMIFIGVGFKISLVPFHFWAADVYEGAPTVISNYLSVISKGGAVYVLMTLLFITFKAFQTEWNWIMYGISILTMLVGNLFALRQQNMKRFLAFSSVAQAGFILLAMLSNNELGVKAIIYFLLIYIFSNVAAFGVVQVISLRTGKENIDDYTGLYRTNPKLSLVLMIALFSLAGIPPVAGFFAKFFLYAAAASKGYYLLIFIAVLNVTISLYYYLLPVRAAFLRTSENPIPYFKIDNYSRLAFIIVMIGLLVLGLYSGVFEYISNMSNIL